MKMNSMKLKNKFLNYINLMRKKKELKKKGDQLSKMKSLNEVFIKEVNILT